MSQNQSVNMGGIVPLALAVAMLVFLPELVRYMVAKGQPVDRIRAALRRIYASLVAAVGLLVKDFRHPKHVSAKAAIKGEAVSH